MILSFDIVPWYLVSVIFTLMLDISHAVEVLVFTFAGGVRCHTSVVFLNTLIVVACHIYSWFLPMSWGLGLSILLSIYCVYIYVRLIMSSYLLFCTIYFSMFGISHAVCDGQPDELQRHHC